MVKRNGRKNSKLILNLNSSASVLSSLFRCYDDVCAFCCCFGSKFFFSFELNAVQSCWENVEWVDCHNHIYNKGWDDVEIATVTFFKMILFLFFFTARLCYVFLFVCECMLINGLCRFLLLSLMRMDNDYMMIIMWRDRNICNSPDQILSLFISHFVFLCLYQSPAHKFDGNWYRTVKMSDNFSTTEWYCFEFLLVCMHQTFNYMLISLTSTMQTNH